MDAGAIWLCGFFVNKAAISCDEKDLGNNYRANSGYHRVIALNDC